MGLASMGLASITKESGWEGKVFEAGSWAIAQDIAYVAAKYSQTGVGTSSCIAWKLECILAARPTVDFPAITGTMVPVTDMQSTG